MPRKPYPSDLTDAEWERIAPLIPPAKPGGRPRGVDMREVLNGIFSVTREGLHIQTPCRSRAEGAQRHLLCHPRRHLVAGHAP